MHGSFSDPIDPPGTDDEDTRIPESEHYSKVHHPEYKTNLAWKEYIRVAKASPYPTVDHGTAPKPVGRVTQELPASGETLPSSGQGCLDPQDH